MNWRDILFPWASLREADKDIDSLFELRVKQSKKIENLEQDLRVQKERIRLLKKENDDLDFELRSVRLGNVILKDDLKKLTAIIDDLPKRNDKGRFTSKKDAEALRKPKQSLPQKEAK